MLELVLVCLGLVGMYGMILRIGELSIRWLWCFVVLWMSRVCIVFK